MATRRFGPNSIICVHVHKETTGVAVKLTKVFNQVKRYTIDRKLTEIFIASISWGRDVIYCLVVVLL